MGGWLCCLPRGDEFDSGGDHRCRARCFQSCCGMYEVLVQPLEEQENRIIPTHSLSLSGNAELIEGTSSGSSNGFIDGCDSPSGKEAAGVMYAHENNKNNGGGREFGGLAIGHPANFSVDEKKATGENNFCKIQLSSRSGKEDSLSALADEEDICPICLEGYDSENPKLTTKCGHSFHLACLLEWKERSTHCAICYKETEFDEIP